MRAVSDASLLQARRLLTLVHHFVKRCRGAHLDIIDQLLRKCSNHLPKHATVVSVDTVVSILFNTTQLDDVDSLQCNPFQFKCALQQ